MDKNKIVTSQTIKQVDLFNDTVIEDNTSWREEWRGMPEFVQNDEQPYRSLIVHFETQADVDIFSELINQNITDKTKSLWFPESTREKPSTQMYLDE